VLTATGLVNGRWQFSTAPESTPLNRSAKTGTGDCVGGLYGTVTHNGPLQRTDRYNFEFLKIQDAGGRHLENHKNRDISATV